jgi:hypothetical protein
MQYTKEQRRHNLKIAKMFHSHSTYKTLYDDSIFYIVYAYNETREHGGINGLTPSGMFLQTFDRSHNGNNTKQKNVTDVGNQNCYLSV